MKEKMQCRANVGFGYYKARTNQSQSSLKQGRSHITYWMWLVVVFNIISHIIWFKATFCITSKGNPHSGLNIAAVTKVSNPCNSHRGHIWKAWNHRPQLKCGFYNPHNRDYFLLWLNPDCVDYSINSDWKHI